jgi:uncharacterized membrane protein
MYNAFYNYASHPNFKGAAAGGSKMNTSSTAKTKRMVGMALFTGIILVLQLIGTFVKPGAFSISLVLIPIVVGAALYGVKAGAYFGGVFGVFVLLACIFGWDAGGNILWNVNPVLTAILCILKGAAAGLAAGIVYTAFSKKQRTYFGVFLAAVACPVVNTGIFLLGMYFFFYDTLVSWAGGASIANYMIISLVGINFLIELLINIVLCPTVARIIKIGKSM